MRPQALMLFAAGKGTRMGALTADRPKPLVEVGGRPLIGHALSLAEPLRPLRLVANVHCRADLLRPWLARHDIAVSDETDRLLETGGGLRKAVPLLGPGPVFTLNTDAVWDGPNPLAALAAAWDPARMDALLLLLPRGNAIGHAGRGDFLVDPAGRLTRGPGAVYSGAQIIDPAVLAPIPDEAFSMNRAWDLSAARGRLFGLVHHGRWCDVGRPESLPLAEALVRAAHVS